jgi:vacuolar protein sorting-associated protein 41
MQVSSIFWTCRENGSSPSNHTPPVYSISRSTRRVTLLPPHLWMVWLQSCLISLIRSCGTPGQVVIYSLSTPEVYSFDKKRPMRTVALEPSFAKRSTRAFVCGGMAGNLIMHEKGWLGHKETLLHSGEGPIWQARWRGHLIAWANDLVRGQLSINAHESKCRDAGS